MGDSEVIEKMSKRQLLSGNQAIARGAWEAGVRVAAGYPGTPGTEILEEIARYPEIYAEWSPNEKVALEMVFGASLAGARSLAAMKHVGLNVASDPFFTMALTGINAGLIVVSADDPGMHSSQNEQDNRYYARAAKVPMLEPSDSQEAKDFVVLGFSLSEKFDSPVLLRTTTRVSHSMSFVETKDFREEVDLPYVKDAAKYVMIPAHARKRHELLVAKLEDLSKFSEGFEHNRAEWGSREIGIITSGISYQYAKEVFPDASILKIGMSYPLPLELIKSFAREVERVYVIEELEPYLEEQIRALGIEVTGKDRIPRTGELSPSIVREAFGFEADPVVSVDVELPARPPVLCPGCPHRGVFYVLRKLKLVVAGDIGCYTLAAIPPTESMDTCLCMGAGIGAALGFEKASADYKGKVVAVIGDSTFIHSGITPLIDIVYNQGASTVIILDNRTTAMTGRQDHPATGITLKKGRVKVLSFEELAKAIGVQPQSVRVVDPYNLQELEQTIREEITKDEPSVIISRRACCLIEVSENPPYEIISSKCVGCDRCLKLGCPAIFKEGDEIRIDALWCNGCGLCYQLCKLEAIKRMGEGAEA
jgi:indolepyruvate ferredoxin oxidoreductase alpha subunit